MNNHDIFTNVSSFPQLAFFSSNLPIRERHKRREKGPAISRPKFCFYPAPLSSKKREESSFRILLDLDRVLNRVEQRCLSARAAKRGGRPFPRGVFALRYLRSWGGIFSPFMRSRFFGIRGFLERNSFHLFPSPSSNVANVCQGSSVNFQASGMTSSQRSKVNNSLNFSLNEKLWIHRNLFVYLLRYFQ